ncbi:hypothetical protein SAMN05444920_13242 [Nonomuraea solani]|uniref:Uncharacterized protein n=1 Tax=Nonomuraea solani TaxID=1144553 RepID=A0A1H6F0A1_9ACTN|nr:hypothetical protein SAMN05444920_13242 [Nonomuraea solani]
MNLEAQILDLMLRIRMLEMTTRMGADITRIGIALMLSELADSRTEMRQDLAALGDELAGLRRHMNDHVAALRAEILHRLGTIQQHENQPTTQHPVHR